MRVRALDADGDMVFGAGAATFIVNTPQAVVQCVLTALRLFQGEWFLDITAGMPWNTQVIGIHPQSVYDNAIRTCIRGVTGVTGISSYNSSLNSVTRQLTVTVSIATAYGDATFFTTLPFAPPITSGFGVGGFGETLVSGS